MVDQAAARELFEHELGALVDAEEKFAEALGKIVPQIQSPKLSELLGRYREITKGQVRRLGEIFKLLKVSPQRATSEGMDGLIAEFENFVGAETPAPIAFDVCVAGLASKVASYQGACYKYLNGLANASNNNNCAILVYDSQTEERDMIQNIDRLVVELYQALSAY
jgi:ferritin-like metal-binding protein YciE